MEHITAKQTTRSQQKWGLIVVVHKEYAGNVKVILACRGLFVLESDLNFSNEHQRNEGDAVVWWLGYSFWAKLSWVQFPTEVGHF